MFLPQGRTLENGMSSMQNQSKFRREELWRMECLLCRTRVSSAGKNSGEWNVFYAEPE
jgi:hypothetical protein